MNCQLSTSLDFSLWPLLIPTNNTWYFFGPSTNDPYLLGPWSRNFGGIHKKGHFAESLQVCFGILEFKC